jgi:hypothetical protein
MSLLPFGGDTHKSDPRHPSDHGSEHCALGALTAFTFDEPTLPTLAPVPLHETGPPRAHPPSQAQDACASWIARLKHGPPALA